MKTQTYFMTDFASRDPRSAHAHIKGVSVRATAYRVFASVASVCGRNQTAARDYMLLSRGVFRMGTLVLRGAKKLARVSATVLVPIVGIAGGAGVYYLMFMSG